MKLDKRIIEGKKPLSCFDTEEAKQFIGKEGYFTNHLGVFAHIRRIEKYMLTAIDEKAQSCFKDVDGVRWDWFLPTEWVKPEEPEKKYRPYSLEEFLKIFDIGVLVEFRVKNSDELKCAMFTGYITDCERIDDKTPGAVELMLGNFHYSLFSLFEDFELFFEDKWQPFGIIDEDKE